MGLFEHWEQTPQILQNFMTEKPIDGQAHNINHGTQVAEQNLLWSSHF
jgi:hypothetical protein